VAGRGLTGVLLVGGASSRFGSPKALARVGGRTLAERAWETLAFCDERLAVGKAGDDLDLPFPVLDDGAAVRAPIAGVVAGLRAARHEVCVVLPVDTPRVGRRELRALAEACADAAVPQTGPLPGAYRKTALPALEAALAAGRLSLREALARLDAVRVEVDAAVLIDVNTRDDLARL
jgi:molybdopterin-guanine dinucleotide biosynthesis protein A